MFDKIKFQRFVSNKKFLPDSFTAFKNKIGFSMVRTSLQIAMKLFSLGPTKTVCWKVGRMVTMQEETKSSE